MIDAAPGWLFATRRHPAAGNERCNRRCRVDPTVYSGNRRCGESLAKSRLSEMQAIDFVEYPLRLLVAC